MSVEQSSKTPVWTRHGPVVASIMVGFVGSVVLLGWAANIAVFKSIAPQWVTMKANTAACFVLAGLALWGLRREDISSRWRFASRACAALVALAGLLTLGEYVLQVQLGLDQLLFRDDAGALETSSPGRMSPATAFNFLLVGLALLGLDWKTPRGGRPTQLLAVLAASIGLLDLAGYLYGVKSLYAFSPFSSMAIHTALSFMVLSTGVLCARAGDGPLQILTSEGLGGALVRRLMPFAIGLPLALGWLRLQGERAGFYGFEFGLALFAVSNVLVFGALIWFTAVWLNRADAERKMAGEALRESFKEICDLKTALDEHAIVAITDPRGKIFFVNDKFCAISKYSRAELLGQDHRIVNSGHHPKEFIRDLWTTITHGQVWHGEIKNKAKDGSFYWVDTTIVPFLNEQGKPRQYVAIRADITERKKAEDALKASFKEVADLKTALDVHAIVAITDPQGNITFVNDKFCEVSKHSRAELLGQNIRIINSGHHPKEFFRDLWTTIGQGKVWRGEIKNKAKDGSFYWGDTTIVPLLDAQGKPRQYVAIRADITERKKADVAAAHLAAIVESSEDAIVGKDLRGIITSWNEGAARMFGYSAAEIIGQPVTRLVPPERLDEETRIHDQIALGKNVHSFDTVRVRKDGSTIDVSVAVSAIKDAAGNIIGASKTARDITERKQAEVTMKRVNEDLEIRVKARTIELHRSNQELEQFAYVASHDLQEPLRAVSGCVQIFQRRYKGSVDAAADELIQHIVEGVDRMQALILDLLTYSRVGTKGQEFAAVDSAAAVQRALEHLEAGIRDSHTVIKQSPLPTVRADPTQLAQLFQNLVGNAIKYRGAQPPQIQIEARRQGDTWKFSVRDNGIGIEPQFFERIFVLFQRLHTRREYAGTGIGLALCKKIVDHHGGRIWVESTLGQGSTFYFTMPAVN